MLEELPIPEKHKYLFDIYFHLGLGRNAMKLAKVSMPRLYPELEAGTKDYQRRLKSTYTRFSRWIAREGWEKAVSIRESSSRRQTDVLVKQEEQTLLDTVKLYRRGVRYVLNKFLENVANDLVDIKTPKEAKMLMELDMYLSTVIEKRPKLINAKIFELMSEDERRQSDKVFEYIRRQAQREEVIQDIEGVIDVEQDAIEAQQTAQLLPSGAVPIAPIELKEAEPGPVQQRFMHLPAFLKPIGTPDPSDAQIEGKEVSRISSIMSTKGISTLEGDAQDMSDEEADTCVLMGGSIAEDEPLSQAKTFDELIAGDGEQNKK